VGHCPLCLAPSPRSDVGRSLARVAYSPNFPTGVQTDYAGFNIENHRREIDAKWSRNTLAVKIREDDLVARGAHAFLRRRSRASTAERRAPDAELPTLLTLPAAPTLDRRAVAGALLGHGRLP
jgi:hypothetical protein